MAHAEVDPWGGVMISRGPIFLPLTMGSGNRLNSPMNSVFEQRLGVSFATPCASLSKRYSFEDKHFRDQTSFEGEFREPA